MRKTKNYKYLHADLFFLFFVGFAFFGSASIVQLWDSATNADNGTRWQYYIIRGSWIGCGVVAGLICSYFFLAKVMNKDEDVVSQIEFDGTPSLHTEGEEIDDTGVLGASGESVDGDAESENEEIFVNPELNI